MHLSSSSPSSDRCLGNVRPHLFSSLQCFNPHHLLLLLWYDSTEMTSYLHPKYHINCSFKQSLHFRSKLVHPPSLGPNIQVGLHSEATICRDYKIIIILRWVGVGLCNWGRTVISRGSEGGSDWGLNNYCRKLHEVHETESPNLIRLWWLFYCDYALKCGKFMRLMMCFMFVSRSERVW